MDKSTLASLLADVVQAKTKLEGEIEARGQQQVTSARTRKIHGGDEFETPVKRTGKFSMDKTQDDGKSRIARLLCKAWAPRYFDITLRVRMLEATVKKEPTDPPPLMSVHDSPHSSGPAASPSPASAVCCSPQSGTTTQSHNSGPPTSSTTADGPQQPVSGAPPGQQLVTLPQPTAARKRTK